MSDFGQAILMKWDGESMIPANPRWAANADRQLVVGEAYMIREHAERSTAEHNHYFGCVRHAWLNLPDGSAGLSYAISAEHLRSYALIRCGYCDSQTFVANSKAEAIRLAAFIRPIDDFAIVTVDGCTVTRLTAQSQSKKAMGVHVFQESKQAVLEFLADLIGVRVEDLTRVTKEAA